MPQFGAVIGLIMRFFTAAILILASSAMLLGAPKPPPPPLKLDQNAVLYITIIQNLDHRYGNFGESDRFYYMEHEIEKAIELPGARGQSGADD